jgi:hypothetical protein
MCTATSIGLFKGLIGVDYVDRKGKECTSSIPEVRSWVNTHELQNASTTSRPPLQSKVTKWYNSHGQTGTNQPINSRFTPDNSPSTAEKPKTLNRLAQGSYKQVMGKRTRNMLHGEEVPRNTRDADNMDSTWFQSEDKETGGMLDFETWERMDQSLVTSAIRKKALRAHRVYTIKRPPKKRKKNRLVAQDNRQHPDTYTDTTSPVAALMEARIFSTIINSRACCACTGDSKNACLHSKLKDLMFIVISEGCPGAGEIVILRKASCGTKQDARCYYDLFAGTLKALGLTQCPLSPCLWRCLTTNPATNSTEACFILFYSDDNLIGGGKACME